MKNNNNVMKNTHGRKRYKIKADAINTSVIVDIFEVFQEDWRATPDPRLSQLSLLRW